MKMMELCAEERPREKMISAGPSGLSNGELLAIVLRNGSKGESALELARRLLESCGSLAGLFNKTADWLKSFDGVGPCKSAEILAVFELGKRFMEESSGATKTPIVTARMVFDLVSPRLKGLAHEETRVLFLNAGNYLLSQEQIGVGDGVSTIIDVPRILRLALEKKASGMILIHNHPTGNPRPSEADIETTKSLRTALNALGLSLLDHVIVSDRKFFSFADDSLYEA
ncbi:MAG: DNA repair protein RadC [Bacteroidia bacterium]|nr:DNA repair protein RadC [Bacteroidia bacterium]